MKEEELLKTYDGDVLKICLRVCELEADLRQKKLCEGVLDSEESTLARQRIAENSMRRNLTFTAIYVSYFALAVATYAMLLSPLGASSLDEVSRQKTIEILAIVGFLVLTLPPVICVVQIFSYNRAMRNAVAYEIFHRRLDRSCKQAK